MIVPRSRLLHCVAGIILPATLLAAFAPGGVPLLILAAAGLGSVALIDAARARQSVDGITIDLPAVVRTSRNREATVEVRILNDPPRPRSLRVALGLPPEVRTDNDEVEVTLPASSEWSRMLWKCTPLKRGNYQVRSSWVEGVSPFGLWASRKELPVQSEVRVYPNLLTERRNMAAMFLNRGNYGVHAHRQVGRGRDFEKLREYLPGDSFDEIYWKAAAKRGKPITKVFQIERTQEIYVVIDASRLSAREPAPGDLAGTILERLITAALMLGLAAEQQGDLFGLVTFTDRVEHFVRASSGKAHYSTCRDAIYALQPRIVSPDYDELCTFLRLRLRRRALIFFLTSLDDPAVAESFVRNVELIRRQHLILAGMIRQQGIEPVFTDPKVTKEDDIYRKLGGHLQWQRLRQLGKTLQRRGVRLSLVDNEKMSAELVSQYLDVKQRQLI